MRRLFLGMAVFSVAVIAPLRATADDQKIAQHIAQRLNAEKSAGKLKGYDIQMRVDKGDVWLSGSVANQDQLQRVLNIAANTTHLGTKRVMNQVNIDQAQAPAKPAATKAPAKTDLLSGLVKDAKLPFAGSNKKTPAQTASSRRQVRTAEFDKTAKNSRRSVLPKLDLTPLRDLHTRLSRQPAKVPTENAQPATQAPASSRRIAAAPVANAGPAAAPATSAAPVQIAAAAAAPAPAATAPVAAPGQAIPQGYAIPAQAVGRAPVYNQTPVAFAPAGAGAYPQQAIPAAHQAGGPPMAAYMPAAGGPAQIQHDHPNLPPYAWPAYAAHPNYAAVNYPKQYSPTAWPYIGPFYPYPQVPLGWRKVVLEWDDGWWMLDFKNRHYR